MGIFKDIGKALSDAYKDVVVTPVSQGIAALPTALPLVQELGHLATAAVTGGVPGVFVDALMQMSQGQDANTALTASNALKDLAAGGVGALISGGVALPANLTDAGSGIPLTDAGGQALMPNIEHVTSLYPSGAPGSSFLPPSLSLTSPTTTLPGISPGLAGGSFLPPSLSLTEPTTGLPPGGGAPVAPGATLPGGIISSSPPPPQAPWNLGHPEISWIPGTGSPNLSGLNLGVGLGSILDKLKPGGGNLPLPSLPGANPGPGTPGVPGALNQINPIATAAGIGLLGAGMLGDETPSNFQAPANLSPEEQAQIDALIKNSNAAYGTGRANMLNAANTEEANYAKRLAQIENPLLLEEANQIREKLGAGGLGSSGAENSGAIGEALARAMTRRAAQREENVMNVFAPLHTRYASTAMDEALQPLQYQEGGAQRLFSLRDLAGERQFASDQAVANRKAQRKLALIGAGGNILARGLAGPSGPFSSLPFGG